jgi:uncharacterized protein YndB with AHSA1/START domain
MSALLGQEQIDTSIVIEAPPEAVWEVLADSAQLADWFPAVEEVLACSTGREGVGATRTCAAKLGSRSGTMVERCVEFIPTTRIAYIVDDESFGMRRMFDHYGFALDLDGSRSARTKVTLRTFYTPRSPVYSMMNRLVVRRQFRGVCRGILEGLKSFTEARSTSAAEAGPRPASPDPTPRGSSTTTGADTATKPLRS